MKLESLHAAYCALTGLQVRFCFHERTWFEFDKAGFTESDLHTVIGFLTRENRGHRDWKYSLKISKLIEDLARFDEFRAEALAVARNRRAPMTPKEQVLQEFSPVVAESAPPPTNVIPIREALKKAVAGL